MTRFETCPISRRRFLRRAASTGIAAVGAPAILNALGANETIRLGAIGTGGRGQRLVEEFRRQGGVEFLSVCDVYPDHLEKGAKKAGEQVDKVVDYRRVLDRKDVDAVMIATPEHQHAVPLIDAVNAGKDVYIEKPLSHTIAEGREMVQAARKNERIVQVGMQQRSAPHFLEARDVVQSGRLGDIHLVTSYWYQDFLSHQTAQWTLPRGLDWKRFLGSAPFRKLEDNPGRFWDWRYYWDYSGGALCDNGTHVNDWVDMLMGDKESPISATCTGGKYVIKRWDTPDVFSAAFEYQSGWLATLSFNYTESYPFGHFHESQFHGTDGLLKISRRGWSFYERGNPEPKESHEERGSHAFHVRNFLQCVRSRKRPTADIEIGHRAVTTSHLGNMAYRQGRKVLFDAVKREVKQG